MSTLARFVKIPTYAGGTKLCSRRDVNPDLSVADAFNEHAFKQLLEHAFGVIEQQNDGFTINILDQNSQIVFEAYSGSSGPAYGGAPNLFIVSASGEYTLDPTVRSALREFEYWLKSVSED